VNVNSIFSNGKSYFHSHKIPIMKKIFTLLTFSIFTLNAFSQSNLTFHDYSAATILGDTISLSQYFGKKVMVVNTASYCQYTPQYADLELLYTQYQQYNFEIIGFPCNDFLNQDPHDDSTINQFCNGYGVTFQMMSKIATVSADTAPVYKWLQRADLNGVANAQVAWNFNKFLIDEAGHWVAHYLSPTNPLDTAITNWIMSPSVTASVHSITSDANNLIQLTSVNTDNSSINLKINNQESQKINIGIYSVDGKLINKIYSGNSIVNQQINFNVLQLSSGMYFIKAATNNAQQTIKLALVK